MPPLGKVNHILGECCFMDDNQAIHAFTYGLFKGSSLRHRLVREQVKDLGSMLEIASK